MSVLSIDIGEPFFTLRMIEEEVSFSISGKVILLNLADHPLKIKDQNLPPLSSVIVKDTDIANVTRALVIERFADYPDEDGLMSEIRALWPSAYEVRGEERLRGIAHYMSPKIWINQLGLTLYHSASVPLNVGLHKFHDFCPEPGFREVHTQIVGFGKMQQCHERNIDTLYLEEPMAPGITHRPMYDAEGNYPWHQFETITPSIFMAVEMLPEGVQPPGIKGGQS